MDIFYLKGEKSVVHCFSFRISNFLKSNFNSIFNFEILKILVKLVIYRNGVVIGSFTYFLY